MQNYKPKPSILHPALARCHSDVVPFSAAAAATTTTTSLYLIDKRAGRCTIGALDYAVITVLSNMHGSARHLVCYETFPCYSEPQYSAY